MERRSTRVRILLPMVTFGLTSSSVACSSGASSGMFETLNGQAPLVIGHRGFPGVRPEETQPSYELAADAGADALEQDLHLSKDCVLMARHNPWLSDNTNILAVAMTNAEVEAILGQPGEFEPDAPHWKQWKQDGLFIAVGFGNHDGTLNCATANVPESGSGRRLLVLEQQEPLLDRLRHWIGL